MAKSQLARGVCGVGPAESTGKPRSRYCPGGMRALVSLCWRRPRNPREKKPSLISLPPDLLSLISLMLFLIVPPRTAACASQDNNDLTPRLGVANQQGA